MKRRSATATLEIPIPNWNRESFTDMLIAGKTTVPWTNRELLIDDPFFYSHEWLFCCYLKFLAWI